MVFLLGLAAVSSMLGLTTSAPVGVELTRQFFQDIQNRPFLMYECYRTGVTLDEPENGVNFTVLWDATRRRTDTGKATTWVADSGAEDGYTERSFYFRFDEDTSSIRLKSIGDKEYVYELAQPLNGLAYYFLINMTRPDDRKVHKLYDVDSRCGNAAALLRAIESPSDDEFAFTREVEEPSRICIRTSLCAPTANCA